MATVGIPLSFILSRHQLTWLEASVGIREGWLEPSSAIELALGHLEAGSDDPDEIELAGLLKTEESQVTTIIFNLCARDKASDERTARLTWLRLLMTWLFENRERYDDALAIVEGLYADFAYPAEIAHLVRFNPSEQVFSSKEEAVAQLYLRWKQYVDSCWK